MPAYLDNAAHSHAAAAAWEPFCNSTCAGQK